MTAHAMKGDRERCLECGMDDYLSKPIRADDLFQALERVSLAEARAAGTPPGGTPRPGPGGGLRPGSSRRLGGGPAPCRRRRAAARRIAGRFLAEIPQWRANLRQAVERQDAERVTRLAHTIKGSMGQFAARPGKQPPCVSKRPARRAGGKPLSTHSSNSTRSCARLLPVFAEYAES